MAQDLAREFVADLYRRERSGMTRSVARIAGESHAEDLVHDAFVAYLTKSPWATRPGAWVATVARNRALNELRRPRLVPLTGVEPDDDQPSPDAEREAIRTTVASALAAIPARSITALRMKFFEGCDYPEIASALGVRIAQAHVIVHRALRRLGRELVNRMAAVHGASDCAPALLRMAGLSAVEDAHDADPCPACRPAWDEIVALRIGGWIPLPLLA
ncbi:MAG: RNA polymerase sigma factor, partial [Actinomycetota bacterium]